MRWRRRGRLELDQLDAFGHLVSDRKPQRLHLAVRRCSDGMFHLHGLEDQEGRAFCDARARLDQQRDNLARHRRDQSAFRAGAFAAVIQRIVITDYVPALITYFDQDLVYRFVNKRLREVCEMFLLCPGIRLRLLSRAGAEC